MKLIEYKGDDPFVRRTYQLIHQAFGDEVPEKFISPVIMFLTRGLSHQVSAECLSLLFGWHASDARRLALRSLGPAAQPDQALYDECLSKLNAAGFPEWLLKRPLDKHPHTSGLLHQSMRIMTPGEKKVYEKKLLSGLDPILKPAGFRRSGTLHRLLGPDAVAMVWVQRSRSAEPDEYQFTINLGSYSKLVMQASGFVPPKPDFGSAQLRWRLGEIRGDRWWSVRNDEQMEAVAKEVAQLFSAGELAELLAISTDEGMLKCLESGRARGTNELGRQRMMALLRNH